MSYYKHVFRVITLKQHEFELEIIL